MVDIVPFHLGKWAIYGSLLNQMTLGKAQDDDDDVSAFFPRVLLVLCIWYGIIWKQQVWKMK